MPCDVKVRWGWLRFMYVYTIVVAGVTGLGIIVAPGLVRSLFQWPAGEPAAWERIVLGTTGSVFVAFAILAALGLRSPLKFAPVLLLQFCYKVIWFVGVLLPLVAARKYPTYGVVYALVFASYVAGDLIAIPFGHVFARAEAEPCKPRGAVSAGQS